MRKLSAFIIVVIVTLLAGYSAAFAASSEPYFSNNKALDGIFAKLEKEFLQYEKDEVIPVKEMVLIGTEEDKKNIKPRPTKKITDAQVKAAAEKKLNDIKVAIEIKEEELGGLSQQEYKIISDHIEDEMFFARKSDYGWDYDAKTVSLYLSLSSDDEMVDFKGLVGNLARMGKEKDQPDQADLLVKDKIIRYLNQSIQKGNKVSQEIMDKLPGEVEKLFIERDLSKIIAARMLARIHEDIYTPDVKDPDADHYDGSKSIEEIMESYGASIDNLQYYREEEKELEYYEYSNDAPSSKYRDYITEEIIRGELPETFTHGFKDAITLDEFAKLHFGSRKLDENIYIEDSSIPADSPDYIKQAYVFGVIDSTENLGKPLTRLEAASKLGNSAIYSDWSDSLKIADCNQIPSADQLTVGSSLKAGMKTRKEKFEPQSYYTKEEAIVDRDLVDFHYLRNYCIPLSMQEPSKIIVGKNTINLLFQNNDEIEQYIEDNFEETVLGTIKLTGKYMRIDTGGALIEFFTPEKGIKFTIKNGTKYFDLVEGNYGPRLGYTIEPKVLKDNEKVDMNVQADSVTKKLYTKLDAILAKIIKPGMTQEQKIKAIHDYVVLHVTYDSRYREDQSVGSVMIAIDEGRGVCGDYTLLFKDLCQRISIPCVFEDGDPFTLNHAWNAVFVNGEWKFVDTT